jgi:hypothetical protein
MLGEIKSIYRKYESLEISPFFSEACEENWKNCGRIVGRIVKQCKENIHCGKENFEIKKSNQIIGTK